MIFKRGLKILFLSTLLIFTVLGCYKKEIIIPQYNSNIVLYDKPLDVIRVNIMWKWKLEYGEGGFCGTCIYPAKKNIIWEFTQDNKIIQTYNDTLITNSDIVWAKEKYTYVMTFYYLNGMPWNYMVKGIYNDTLIISDYGPDAISYYLTRTY